MPGDLQHLHKLTELEFELELKLELELELELEPSEPSAKPIITTKKIMEATDRGKNIFCVIWHLSSFLRHQHQFTYVRRKHFAQQFNLPIL